VKEQRMNPRIGWGQPPPGWSQPHFPGWAPLVDPGPRPLRAASSIARWSWPTAAISGVVAVVIFVLGRDDPAPGLSHRGLLTIALAALVVVLLTIHRRYGPRSLARAVAEYTVVALLTTLLAAPTVGAAVDQQPTNRPTRTEAQAQAATGDDRPAVIQAGVKLLQGVTGAARAVAGAVRWLVELWRRAGQKDTSSRGGAMAASPRSPAASVLWLWRCL
jgi:hypothetical protein